MMTLIPAAIVLMTLNNASGMPQAPAAYSQSPAEDMSQTAEVSRLLRALHDPGYAESQWAQAWQDVFVVPAPDLSPENLAQITEDMVVMCRIIDKSISANVGIAGATGIYEPYPMGVFEKRARTQGLYLDGHGALFFIEVNFLLVQSEEEQEQPAAEPSGDAVWSQTVDELKGVPRKQPDARATAYSAQKVENLKSALVKSLRHATNLRVRRPEERIALVVTSRSQIASYASVGRGRPSTGWVGSSAGWVGSSAEDATSELLVLSTTKSDVDAFAKGTLTLEQFTGKVSTLNSWTSSVQQSSASPDVVLPSSGVSTSGRR